MYGLQFRAAGSPDARAIAELHADSWRRHYRGAYSDAFLDGDVAENRLSLWSERLSPPGSRSCTILAERRDELVGFAHTVWDGDAACGALLDNLHVVHGRKRRGIGTQLLSMTACAVLDP
ncbi:MAG: GNAT family N-acetyltransferase [Solirubrobacteraceae bacterium]